VCIVTGGAQGIGRAILQRLAKEGARAVCIFDQADGAEAARGVEEASPGVRATAVRLDLTEARER
ncbi:unnamed protein product, partial [Effrenium voratum]